jgi:hypothetical protein
MRLAKRFLKTETIANIQRWGKNSQCHHLLDDGHCGRDFFLAIQVKIADAQPWKWAAVTIATSQKYFAAGHWRAAHW